MAAYPDELPDSGAVFTFGKSRFADNEPSHFFIKNDPVVAISCGDEHSAVICQQGRVFVFGGNSSGQLGLGHTEEVARPSCVKWLKPHRALFVACGRAHTVFVTDTNAVYTVGDNSEGQLGIGSQESQSIPQYVDLDSGSSAVRQVSAGSAHTAVLTESGQVFVCGCNTAGQLGLGEDVKSSATFRQVKFMENIAFVECGYRHTVFITSQGIVFVTGENEGQKLGTNNTAQNIYVPEVLPIDVPIKSACCGASHTFLLSMDEAKILAFGSNERGQLGLPQAVVDVTVPTEIDMDKMFDGFQLKLIACGATHTAFVTGNGLLYTCGEAKNNKLCLDEVDDVDNTNQSDQYTPKRVTAMNGFIVDNVACGGCHTLLTATKALEQDLSADLSLVSDATKHISLTELPPLQKLPVAAMKPIEVTAIQDSRIQELTEDNNGNENVDDKSIDSLEPNVSGSHIANINDLDNGNDNASIHEVPEITDEINSNPTNASDHTLETEINFINVENKIPVVEDPVTKETHVVPGDICCGGRKTLDVVHDTHAEIQHSPPSKSPKLEPDKLLKLPDIPLGSPDVSRRSAGSQKSETPSKSENETITCDDDEKRSPLQEKQAKTQAVMPIVRSDETLATLEQRVNDVAEEISTDRSQDKGRLGKIFQSIRDKENSCMGKGKVIENVVTENINKGINGAEETAHRVEESIETGIRNQTNSTTCVIL